MAAFSHKRLLEYPLYVVDEEQAVRVGETFLSSGKISGIILESASSGILLSNITGKDSSRIPKITRNIYRDELFLGKFSITFSDEKIIYTLSSFGAITLLIILGVLLANIAANRYLIVPRVRKPFTSIFSALKKMAEGNYEIQIAPASHRDVNALVSLINNMASEINRKTFDLQESEFRFKAFFDLAPFSCVVTDLQSRYRMVNRAFCRQFGLSEDDVIGQTEDECGITTDNVHSGNEMSFHLRLY